jgi:hypothetical protein
MVEVTREAALELIAQHPGISDRELAERVYGPGSPGTMVNLVCRKLAEDGLTKRRFRPDYLLGNWPAESDAGTPPDARPR